MKKSKILISSQMFLGLLSSNIEIEFRFDEIWMKSVLPFFDFILILNQFDFSFRLKNYFKIHMSII